MPEAKLIGFALCMLALVAVIPLLARRATREASAQVRQAREQIGARGFAVEHAASQYGRRIVRVWGRLDHPVRLRLRVRSRRRFRGDARGPGIGHAGGVADRFERHFRVTTNEPDRARLVLDPVVQEKLLAVQGHRGIDFRVGSADSLLSPEYWADAGAERHLRELWMLRVKQKKKPKDLAPFEALGEVGLLLAAAVDKHCLPPQTPDRQPFQTSWVEEL